MALSILNAISGGSEQSGYGPLFIIEKDSYRTSPLPFYRENSVDSVSSSASDDVRIGYFPDKDLETKIYSGINEEEAQKTYDVESGDCKKRNSLPYTIWVSLKSLITSSVKRD